jgi:hypothetical protein
MIVASIKLILKKNGSGDDYSTTVLLDELYYKFCCAVVNKNHRKNHGNFFSQLNYVVQCLFAISVDFAENAAAKMLLSQN